MCEVTGETQSTPKRPISTARAGSAPPVWGEQRGQRGVPTSQAQQRQRGASQRCQPGCPALVSDPPGGRGPGAYLTSLGSPAQHLARRGAQVSAG